MVSKHKKVLLTIDSATALDIRYGLKHADLNKQLTLDKIKQYLNILGLNTLNFSDSGVGIAECKA